MTWDVETFDGLTAEEWVKRMDEFCTDPATPAVRWPTLVTIGLGDALDAVERVCAWAQQKHPGNKWAKQTIPHQASKLIGHLGRGLCGELADEDTGEHAYAHVAARALMLLGLVLRERAEVAARSAAVAIRFEGAETY